MINKRKAADIGMSKQSKELRDAAKELNPRQRQFANGVLEGISQTQSYMSAYPNCSIKTAESKSSALVRHDKVARYLEVANAQVCEKAKVSRVWALEQLKEIAQEPSSNTAGKVAAIALISKMEGWDKPAKVEISVNPLERLVYEIQSE